jgi:energy-coupling factor transporter ATP-binding protein EcfA2
MLKRLYVHNFRCLENFELKSGNESVLLLLGKNGSGKSTIAVLLKILQTTVLGQNRVSDIFSLSDFAYNRIDTPVRIEIEVLINGETFTYILVLELPENFKEPRVAQESLTVNETVVFSREKAQISLFDLNSNHNVNFSIDWHLFGLPVIQERSDKDPIAVFKKWLARMVVISPIPALVKDQTNGKTLQPKFDCSNFAEWLAGLLAKFPASYTAIDKFLRQIMPDLKDL